MFTGLWYLLTGQNSGKGETSGSGESAAQNLPNFM